MWVRYNCSVCGVVMLRLPRHVTIGEILNLTAMHEEDNEDHAYLADNMAALWRATHRVVMA